MRFTEWVERRQANGVVGRYLREYRGRVAAALNEDGRVADLSLENLYWVHRHAHVGTVKAIGLTGVPFSRYAGRCEAEGVRTMAQYLGRIPDEFFVDLGWDAWYRGFARASRLLPGLCARGEALGIPPGEEPFWTWIWSVASANDAAPWLGRSPEGVAYCMTRIGPQLPRLLGCEAKQAKDWYLSPRLVSGEQVHSALRDAGLGDLELAVFRDHQEPTPIDPELDAPFRTRPASPPR